MAIDPQAQRVLDQDPGFGDDFDPAATTPQAVRRLLDDCWMNASARLPAPGRRSRALKIAIFRAPGASSPCASIGRRRPQERPASMSICIAAGMLPITSTRPIQVAASSPMPSPASSFPSATASHRRQSFPPRSRIASPPLSGLRQPPRDSAPMQTESRSAVKAAAVRWRRWSRFWRATLAAHRWSL